MDDYQLLVTYTDFYGVWKKKIQPSLIREGPLSINLELPIKSEITQNCNYFSPQFVESEEGDSLCQLFVIAYDSKFDTNQTTEINIWRSKNPGKAFLVLILSIAKTQWSFTTQRSKIESMFNQVVPTSRVVIAKYLLDKEESISESDMKTIHSSLANLIQISNQDQIRTLQQKITDIEVKSKNIDPDLYAEITTDYIRISSELASLYHTFGFLSQSKEIYRKIISIIMKISQIRLIEFWPPSPKNYDIRRITSKIKFVFGFDMLILSIHGITKSLLQSSHIQELFNDISHCFHIVISNSKTPEELIFSRYWIYNTSVNFCDIIENGSNEKNNRQVIRSFSMIALSQVLKLLEYNYKIKKAKTNQKEENQSLNQQLTETETMDFLDIEDETENLDFNIKPESTILKNASYNNLALADDDSKDDLFLGAWKKSSKVFNDLPYHKSFVSSILFDFYLNKKDITEALNVIKETSLNPECPKEFLTRKQKRRISRVESHVLELIFACPDLKTPELAQLLISSIGAKDSSKMKAIEYLAVDDTERQVYPDFSISPFLFSPGLFEVHDIYDNFHFKLTVSFPKWLCDLTDTMMNQNESTNSKNDNQSDEGNDSWYIPNITIHLLSSELPDGFNLMVDLQHHTRLSEKMTIEDSINCNFSGKFDKMILIIKYGYLYLSWNIIMPHELVILERVAPPSFDLTMPCLLQKGCRQSAIFTAENLDASSMEVTFTFEMEGLEEIIYLKPLVTGLPLGSNSSCGLSSVKVEKNETGQQTNQPQNINPILKGRRKSYQEFIQSEPGQICLSNYEEIRYKPNTPIILYKFESTVKMILVYKIENDEDAVGIIYSFLKRDGTSQTLTQQFSIPEAKTFNIRLFKQTQKMQQFQIVNIFPQTFNFTFNDKKHVMLPHALFSIIREASDSPLELTFYEEGWEKYPVKIVTSNFMLDKLKVKLSFQPIRNIGRKLPKSTSEYGPTEESKPEEDGNDFDENLQKWIVGEPRFVTVEPPAFPMMEDEKNWVIAPQDSVGKTHLFVPKHPGKLPLPKFQIRQQVAEPIPNDVQIMFNLYPPIVPL